MISREEIIQNNPLDLFLGKLGHSLTAKGGELICRCPLHEDKNPSFYVNLQKKAWICRAGCGGGSVIDLMMKLNNISAADAMGLLSKFRPGSPNSASTPRSAVMTLPANKNSTTVNVAQKKGIPEGELTDVYDYLDQTGQIRFQVVRYANPKDFRMRTINPDGSFNSRIEGVEKIPYNLPDVIKSKVVAIVEGEKDVETMRSIGAVATCNSGGAEKWIPAYSQYLKDKQVLIIPDNDAPGQRHVNCVLNTLEGIVEWVKVLSLPRTYKEKPIKDVSDLREACETKLEFLDILAELEGKAIPIMRGVICHSLSISELEHKYIHERQEVSTTGLDLSAWLPSLNLRKLIRGDLLGIIAGTSQCKSAAVQNILACNPALYQQLFSLELSDTNMFERSLAIAGKIESEKVEEIYNNKKKINWRSFNKINNLYICSKSGVDMKFIDAELDRVSVKMGQTPDVFVIDYLQLIRGPGSRYERISEAAEDAKVLAKKWNSVGVILSQIGRPDKQNDDKVVPVTINSAKDSGSIENSCSVLLGMWKTSKEQVVIKVLKDTKGGKVGLEAHGKLLGGSYVIKPI